MSETVSQMLEPVANTWKKDGMEANSTPDFVSQIGVRNAKDIVCEDIDLEESSIHQEGAVTTRGEDRPEESIITSRTEIKRKLDTLSKRWKGTVFQQVGKRCGLVSNWKSNEEEICNTTLDWFIDNSEEQLVNEAWDIVYNLEGNWKRDEMKVRGECRGMLSGNVEILTVLALT
jgi:hypothetical protein